MGSAVFAPNYWVELFSESRHEPLAMPRARSVGGTRRFHATREMSSRIRRTLAHEDPERRRRLVDQDEIVSFAEPVVILGNPGLGKTELTKALGEHPGMTRIPAGKFARSANPDSLVGAAGRVIVDGLDEIASAAPGSAVEAVLEKLSVTGNPPFILSCREADWLGTADRGRIAQDYGAPPVVLHLQPFTRENARNFLSGTFQTIDAEGLLLELEQRGIEGLYGNPLTLRMLGEVAAADGALPETRADLFDRASCVMLSEENALHDANPHARRGEEELLLAAGAIGAAQVLCGVSCVHTGSRPPEDCLRLDDIATLPFGDGAILAIKTRLFRADGENRFAPIHRVIAEYLGAKWLARCFEAGVSEKRIFRLFGEEHGVPTSLRGLHAWLAHFSEALSRRCIDADPYGVLRYGDAETLGPEQARALLVALMRLAEDDPYFRSGDWGWHPASGLMRPELREEILSVVKTPDRPAQLRALFLEAMPGTSLAKELSPVLEEILFDPSRYVEERSAAAEALLAANVCDDWESVIERLLAIGDLRSPRLAFKILGRVGLFGVSRTTSIRVVLAYFGLSPAPAKERPEVRHVPDSLFEKLEIGRLASWLDDLVEAVRPLMNNAHFNAEWHITRLIRCVAASVLEFDPTFEPARVWKWIGWLNGDRADNDESTERLVRIFRENGALRAALLEHVLLTPCANSAWMAGWGLSDTGLDLYPSGEDLAGVVKALRARTGSGEIAIDMWSDLLRFGRTAEDLPEVLRVAAVEAAQGDAILLSVVEEMSKPPAAEWEAERAKRKAEYEQRRQSAYHVQRHFVEENAEAVKAGDVHVLEFLATVYLDRTIVLEAEYRFESGMAPRDRMRAVLGDALAERVMVGFVATLHREDLPSAARIAEVHCDNGYCVAEAPMICGVAELLRRGHSLHGIDRNTLAAAYMAWQGWPESGEAKRRLSFSVPDKMSRSGSEIGVQQMDSIGSALEAALFESNGDWEAHFRTSIEPQLDRNSSHPTELDRLIHEDRFSMLAGKLSVEWLRRYPGSDLRVQTDLLNCGLRNASREETRQLLREIQERTHPNRETEFLWLSADYVVNLEDRRMALETAAAEHPKFIWDVRDRVAPHGGERLDRFSLEHLVFIVEVFGTAWEDEDRPTGVTRGDCNSWDASEFIRQTIDAIAAMRSLEATEALQVLIDRHAPSYIPTIKHALALQLRARRDAEYAASRFDELRAVMANAPPESIDDMRAWFGERLEELQGRIRASDTDMWAAYWTEDARPREENFCRDRLIDHISLHLPPSIRLGRETSMPLGTWADIALTRNTIKLPVEIKGQWHRDVWNAASGQLDAKYTVDWRAEGRGVYIVLWFGDAPVKQLQGHPEGLGSPESPEELRSMLIDRLTKAQRGRIDIFVIDVSRPKEAD